MKFTKVFVKSLAVLLAFLLTAFSFPMNVLADEVLGWMESRNASSLLHAMPEKKTVELTELRTATTKHFRLEDGSYIVAQYDTAIHYPDANGEWQNIDNRLSVAESEIATSDAKIKFAKITTGNESLFTLYDGNRKLTLSLNGASKKIKGQITNNETEFGENATKLEKMTTLDRISASVLYEDILENTDLEYVINGANIKENIIIKAPSEAYSYAFTLSLNHLSAALQENGEIWITDPNTNALVYLIPTPVMWDSNGAFSHSVSTTLDSQGNGKYTMTVTASDDWINDDGRAFPITIDPPIYTSTSNIVDLYCSSTSPSTSFSSATLLQAGEGRIAYWKLSTLPTLPTSAYITNATFYAKASSASGEAYVGVYDVTSGWNAAHTWNRIHAGSPQGTLASDFIDYAKISAAGDCQWTITPLVKKWYGGTNYGLALTEVAEAGKSTYVSLYSNENSSNRPKLCIEYRDMKGLEDYWTYSSQSAGFAGAGSVNHATGNLVFAIPTLTSTDALMPFTPTLVYNTALANLDYTTANVYTAYTTAYTPKGFKMNLQETLYEKNLLGAEGISVLYYVWSDSDGTEHYFLPTTTDGVYADEDGLLLTLTEGTSICTIKDSNDNVRTFSKQTGLSKAWYLSSITDKSGNKLTFTFDSSARPTAVKLEPAGGDAGVIEQLKISYYGNTPYMIWNPIAKEAVLLQYASSYNGAFSPGATAYLVGMMRVHTTGTMTESMLRSYYDMLEYGIEEDGVIVDATATYNYDSAGRLVKVRNELSDYELHYTYTNGKVTAITEKAGSASSAVTGQSLTLTYGVSNTVIRTGGTDDILNTADDLLTTYSFDGQGRTVSCYTTDTTRTQLYGASNGQYVDEEENEKAKNNLKSSVQTTLPASNYIVNGAFESNSNGNLWGWNTSGLTTYSQGAEPGMGTVRVAANANYPTSKLYQDVYLSAGDYTVSIEYDTDRDPDIRAYLRVQPLSGTGEIKEEELALATDMEGGSKGFASLQFNVDSTRGMRISVVVTGTPTTAQDIHVGKVMLSKAVGSAAFDAVVGGHFDYYGEDEVSDYWEIIGNDTLLPTVVTDGTQFGDVLKMDYAVNQTVSVQQTVYRATTNMKVGHDEPGVSSIDRVFTVAGFAKGTAQSYNESALFGIRVTVNYYAQFGAAVDPDVHEFYFDKSTTDWQFISGGFVADASKGMVDTVTVTLLYQGHPGVGYFDGVSLIENSTTTDIYDYNANGYLNSQQNGVQGAYYTYDGNDNVTRAVYTNGVLVDYTYDSLKRLTQEAYKAYNGTFDPDAANPTATLGVITANYHQSYYYFDDGLLSDVYLVDDKNGDQIHTMYAYNRSEGSHIYGALISETDTADFDTTYYFYNDTNGWLMAVLYPNGNGICYTYDGMGNLIKVMPATYQSGGYAATANSASVSYGYNTSNNLLTSITTGSTTYHFSYDVFGNTDEISVGSTKLAEYAYYSNNGKLDTLTYGNGYSLQYVYDDLDRVKEVWYTNSVEGGAIYELLYSYTYTSGGQLHSVEDHVGKEVMMYQYDFSGKLIRSYVYDAETLEFKNSVVLGYDDRSRLFNETHYFGYGTSSGADTEALSRVYHYNEGDDETGGDGMLQQLYLGDAKLSAYITPVYDGLGRTTSKTFSAYVYGGPGDVFYSNTTYEYVSDTMRVWQMTTDVRKTESGATVSSNTYKYTYDANGNITSIKDTNNVVQYQYTYDALGQLVREDNRPLNKSYTWTYDNAGNILSKKTYTFTTGTLGSPDNTQTYTYGNPNWGDLLTEINGTQITYDAIGNPLYIGVDPDTLVMGQSLTWEGRRLMQYQEVDFWFGEIDGTLSTTTYQYNADGIRTSKTVNGVLHEYVLNGSQILAEKVGNALYVYLYDESGSPVGFRYRTSSYAADVFDTYFFEKNLQGDIIAIYNQSGAKIGTYAYDAYGKVTTTVLNSSYSSIVNSNPLRYRGYYYDTESGYYYLQSRYYNPVWGRFLNADSALYSHLLGFNMFAYCYNNPITYIDSTGEAATVCFGYEGYDDLFPSNDIDGVGYADEALMIKLAAFLCASVCVVSGIIVTDVVQAADADSEPKTDDPSKEGDKDIPVPEIDDDAGSLPQQGQVSSVPDAPPVDAGKQGKHVIGHKNDNDPNRSKWRPGENGVRQTQEAWKNSHQPNPKNPQVRIGKSSDGRTIKIHIGEDGIHGYPIFP